MRKEWPVTLEPAKNFLPPSAAMYCRLWIAPAVSVRGIASVDWFGTARAPCVPMRFPVR